MYEKETYVKMLTVFLGAVCCSMWMVACNTLPKSFTPRTPDEQAVAQTVATFLMAWRDRNGSALGMVVTPEATLEASSDGSTLPSKRVLELQHTAENAPLLRATTENLVDFRQDTPERVTVGTYVHDFVKIDRGTDQVSHRIQWELRRQDGQWRVQRIVQTTWVHPLNIRGGGA